jgi:DNA helicase-2/ATP-dependent DNA helicase PcrA
VILEGLVDGAPTLPIGVLLYDEPTSRPVEELLEELADPPVAG